MPLNVQINTPASSYALITKERTEKLELLNHLVANLAHAIVVCGPEGIGKTRLLKGFQDTANESWIFCPIKGDSKFSLERIQELLSETMGKAMPGINLPSLSHGFHRLENKDTKVILAIDDAGELAPSLIEGIISYAEDKPALRVILALTHSELYIKNGTDPAIEDCYQIEIPPLSEQQCGDFLEYLSTLARPRIQFSAINENRVAEIYRETHGIPGNILAQLPTDDNQEKKDYAKLILTYAVIGLIGVALGVQWWSSRPKSDKATTVENNPNSDVKVAQIPIKPLEPAATQAVESQPSQGIKLPTEAVNTGNPAGISNNAKNSVSGQVTAIGGVKEGDTGLVVPSPTANTDESSGQQASDGVGQVEEATPEDQAQLPTTLPNNDGTVWLMAQPAENHTLQLMALTKEQPIIEVVQRHQDLGQNLRYLKTKTKSGKDRFVLLYGSFSSPEQASIEKQKLPKELQKTWLRKMEVIQKELSAVPTGTLIPTDTPE